MHSRFAWLRAMALAGAMVAAASGLASWTDVAPAVAGAAATVHGVPLPSGSRSAGADLFTAGQTFRKTVDHLARWLARTGLAHEAIPVYRYRGVEVARFLSGQDSTDWLAIHVFRHHGKTMIAIVPRTAATSP